MKLKKGASRFLLAGYLVICIMVFAAIDVLYKGNMVGHCVQRIYKKRGLICNYWSELGIVLFGDGQEHWGYAFLLCSLAAILLVLVYWAGKRI